MINNKRAYTEYTVTQPTTDFAIGFDDFDEGSKDNILVTLNGVLVESLGYAAMRKNESTVIITPAITEGTVRLTRETDIDEPFHKFTAGALFSAKSMDENFQQVRHSQQEVRDGFVFLEHNTNGIVQASKEATIQAKAATVEATASAVRAESAADTAVQAVGSLQGVVDAATTATTKANTATATATTAASQATAATTSAQNAAQATNTAKQEATAAAANANAATIDTLAATGRANEAADLVADLVVGKVRAQDVSTVGGSNQEEFNTVVTNKLTRQYVSDVPSLKALTNNTVGEVIYVVSAGVNYIFKITSNSPINTVTVVQGNDGVWEMELRDAYYASWFATPNVQVDQSTALQAGYAYATSVDRPFIVDDVYYAKESNTNTVMAAFNSEAATTVFNLLSNSVIAFTSKGEINLLTSSMPNYNLILGYNVENVSVIHPKLNGDLLSHIGTDGEWGYGLTLYSCKDVYVEKPAISNMFGDGIYIGLAYGTPATVRNNENIRIEYPVIDRVRRNGISFTSGNNVRIIKPIIKSVYGTAPESGIDIEPEEKQGDGMKYASISKSVIDSPHILDCPIAIALAIFGERSVDLRFTGTTVFEVTAEAFKQPSGVSISTRPKSSEGDVIPIQKGLIYFDNVVFTSAVGATKRFGAKINDYTNTALPIVFNSIDLQDDDNFGWIVGANDSEELSKRQGITVNNILMRKDKVLYIDRPDKPTLFSHRVYMSDDIEVRFVGGVPSNLELTNDSHVSGTQYVTELNGIDSKHLAPRVIFDSATEDSEAYRIIRVHTDTRKLDYHVTSNGYAESKKLYILGINYKGKTYLITTSPDSSICFQNNPTLTNTEVFYTFGNWGTEDAPRIKGTTLQRPATAKVGQVYYDTTLLEAGKPISWNGTSWVDALGASV